MSDRQLWEDVPIMGHSRVGGASGGADADGWIPVCTAMTNSLIRNV